MPGLLERCEQYFGTTDLYLVLGLKGKTSCEGEIRRGYHRVSLKVHPDRVPEGEKDEATPKFQTLGKVYAVLSDKEQRAVYDEQGIVDEEGEVLKEDRNWEEYWRLLFKKITTEDIKAFEEEYIGSEEELADVKEAYVDFEGDMDRIMESVLCVTYKDEPRIRKIIQAAIDSGEVSAYDAFVKEPKKKRTDRKKRALTEAAEAEEMKQELGLGESLDDLSALIQVATSLPDPLTEPGHDLQPGDQVYIKCHVRKNNLAPRWKGPFQVVLITGTAVKCADVASWIHASHTKRAVLPVAGEIEEKERIIPKKLKPVEDKYFLRSHVQKPVAE